MTQTKYVKSTQGLSRLTLDAEIAPVSVSASSNGADWHLGVLELPRSGYPDSNEDFYFSGVFIESGPITTAIGGPKRRSEEFTA